MGTDWCAKEKGLDKRTKAQRLQQNDTVKGYSRTMEDRNASQAGWNRKTEDVVMTMVRKDQYPQAAETGAPCFCKGSQTI